MLMLSRICSMVMPSASASEKAKESSSPRARARSTAVWYTGETGAKGVIQSGQLQDRAQEVQAVVDAVTVEEGARLLGRDPCRLLDQVGGGLGLPVGEGIEAQRLGHREGPYPDGRTVDLDGVGPQLADGEAHCVTEETAPVARRLALKLTMPPTGDDSL